MKVGLIDGRFLGYPPLLSNRMEGCVEPQHSKGFMETSLHRELKRLMAGDESGEEQPLAGFRIDAIVDGRLIEVQVASLAAIRAKIVTLLEQGFEVTVVKPLTARKQIVRRERRDSIAALRADTLRRDTTTGVRP